ncbi:hypothetical protein H6P81_015578 [Aristolochia fimbriata]|uniref:Uncharacterized protein n=1 Tax=Aristolochia fimbriata TaxID=158543 RepID=A0AAV7E6G2_ARIFI|nr:hypothetical protein H6P81_015578 [Aristolochia fimbriata]
MSRSCRQKSRSCRHKPRDNDCQTVAEELLKCPEDLHTIAEEGSCASKRKGNAATECHIRQCKPSHAAMNNVTP